MCWYAKCAATACPGGYVAGAWRTLGSGSKPRGSLGVGRTADTPRRLVWPRACPEDRGLRLLRERPPCPPGNTFGAAASRQTTTRWTPRSATCWTARRCARWCAACAACANSRRAPAPAAAWPSGATAACCAPSSTTTSPKSASTARKA